VSNNNEQLHIVTEQGVFGDLSINDPSKKKVPTQEELERMIKEAHERNLGK
jgi:hypothetical protein